MDPTLLARLPPKAREYWTKVAEFVAKNHTEWFLIDRGTEQHKAWARYFRTQGWEPWGMKLMRLGQLNCITVPTEWPEWFDTPVALTVIEGAAE